jgi:hypothetical protein
MKLPHR